MSTNNSEPSWKARSIALIAMVLAVVGGLSLINKPNLDTEPVIAVAANCSEFAANAHKLFDQGDTATLQWHFRARRPRAPVRSISKAPAIRGTRLACWEKSRN